MNKKFVYQVGNNKKKLFLGESAKLWKATISFAMSVRLS